MAVITISRQFGAGGRTLGKMIAEKMGYRFLDELIIKEIAKMARVSKDTVISLERSAGGPISRMISSLLSRDYMERLTGDDRGYLDEQGYVDILQDVMTKLASENNVVLMGRGGQYILQKDPNAFHILLVADMPDRIAFMRRFYRLSDRQAIDAVNNGDKRRLNLYRRMGKQDYDHPELYHLVINHSKVSLEKARDLVCDLTTQEKSEQYDQ